MSFEIGFKILWCRFATGTKLDSLGVGGVYNLGAFLFDAATVIGHNYASDSNDDCFGW
jgi:hypothetical protein